jgi:carbon-monoxide dehydrogenase large subunit
MDEGAEIRVESDGSATLVIGSVNHGQGHETTLAQVVAECLPLAPERIRISARDTDAVPYGRGSFASRTAVLGGSATLRAAEAVMARAVEIAAHLLGADPDEIEREDDVFRVAGTNRSLGWSDIARAAHTPQVLPPGDRAGLSAAATFNADAGPTFPNGCHVCEVEIDIETGVLEIVRYIEVGDVGTALNPMIVEGQIHGGVVQGLAQVMGERMVYDSGSGQPMTGSFMDYTMPRASDVPNFELLHNPQPTAKNPLGAKGAGEAGTVGALPAGLAAVHDALAPLGIDRVDMPATPDRLWSLINAALQGD